MAIIAVAYYTGGAAYNAYMGSAINAAGGAMAITGAQFASASFTASVIGGATSGFVGGFLTSGGDFRTSLKAAASGAVFGAVDGYYGQDWGYQRLGANALAGGVSARIYGTDFATGFTNSFVTGAAKWAYVSVTTYAPDPLPGEQLPAGFYDEGAGVVKRSFAVFGNNDPTTGNFFQDFFKQGGALGRLVNSIPVLNSGAAFHDSLFVRQIFGLTKNWLTNVPTMLPAGIITIGANVDGPLTVQLSNTDRREQK